MFCESSANPLPLVRTVPSPQPTCGRRLSAGRQLRTSLRQLAVDPLQDSALPLISCPNPPSARHRPSIHPSIPSGPELSLRSVMGLETLSIEHVPASHRVHIAYFTDVSNAGFLQSQLLARNPDFEYAFIDATSTVSRVHVLAAVYKALTLLLAGNLKTPNVHSEIVCALSNTTNISESFRRWGITPATRDIIVVKVVCPKDGDPSTTADEPGNIWAHLVRNVQGMPAALTDEEIAKSTDWPKVRRYYKLNAVPGVEACKTDEEKAEEMKVLVLAGMALRGV